AQFVLAYHYIAQGQGEAAVKPLKALVALQPKDALAAQLLNMVQPASASTSAAAAAPPAQPFDAGKLTGNWVAQAPQNAKISLASKPDGGFTGTTALPGKPAMSIAGTTTLADGVLTLNSQDAQQGAMAGQVAWKDDTHFNFRIVGGPPDDPGLTFGR